MKTPGIKSEADKAIEERHALHKQYRAMKRTERERLYRLPDYGDRLRRLAAQLRKFTADDGDWLISFIEQAQLEWLGRAPTEIRAHALELVGDRIIRIRESAGLDPFNDPLPGQDDDVFRVCKRMLT